MSKSRLSRKEDLWTKLRAMRTFTATQGFLHQAQIDQLKLWGRLAFQSIPASGIEIRIDFENNNIGYALSGDLLKDLNQQATLIAGLDRSINEMLGDTWRLIIELNKKDIYVGRRRSEEEAKAPIVKKKNGRRQGKRSRTSRSKSRRS